MTTISQSNTHETLTTFELNKLAAEHMNYIYEVLDHLERVIVTRGDGEPSEFNPCVYASQTTELLDKAMFLSETRFRAKLQAIIGKHDVPHDYAERIAFCGPHMREITLAAVIALKEYADSH